MLASNHSGGRSFFEMGLLRWPWITVVFFALGASFIVPLLLFLCAPAADLFLAHETKEFDLESTSFVKTLSPGHSSTDMPLTAMEQKVGEEISEPTRTIYKDGDLTDVQITNNVNGTAPTVANDSSSRNDGAGKQEENYESNSTNGEDKKQAPSNLTTSSETKRTSLSQSSISEKILLMEDQIIMARSYLQFSSSNTSAQFVKELKRKTKEIEKLMARANNYTYISISDLQKMKEMELILAKARKTYPDCSAQASKFRFRLYNSQENLRVQPNKSSYLIDLTARTFPKGLHCLSMRLTIEYFALLPEEQKFPNSQNVQKPDLYHYAIFSDNVVACAVVLNSTVSSSTEPEKIVFHVVTDSFNFPAMAMWFLLNPPGDATIHIQSLDAFTFLPAGFSSMFMQSAKTDLRYASPLNHLRFYLPEVFPYLDKILFLDHDVVVQRDLRRLWSLDMEGKVIGAVQMCEGNELAHKLEMLVRFTSPVLDHTFNGETCLWALGMNIIDLQQWRTQGLTETYNKWRQIANSQQKSNKVTLPLEDILFHNHTITLNWRWHVFGLGYDSRLGRGEIGRAAVVHYSGLMKPWFDIAIAKYKQYWTSFLDYHNPYFQRCNIHE